MRIGNYFEQTEDGFMNAKLPTRGIPYDNTFHNAITYEVSTTQKRYFRSVYSILDFFSQIGGLLSLFASFCLLIITCLNYFGSFQFLMGESFFDRAEIG